LKPVRFTARAESDVRAIIRYYEDIAPGLSARIVADVRARIAGLRYYPRSRSPIFIKSRAAATALGLPIA
jgi:plasmid stabilization system protein ParE